MISHLLLFHRYIHTYVCITYPLPFRHTPHLPPHTHPPPAQERYAYYHSHKGFTKEAALTAASQVYGRNSFDMPLPAFMELLKEQMLAPFFVFQVFCVGLWCLDEYWYVWDVLGWGWGGVCMCVGVCTLNRIVLL